MADPAQAEAPAAPGSPAGIKQESTTLPDLPDFSLALESLASKRPLESSEGQDGVEQDQASKRIKTEMEQPEAQRAPDTASHPAPLPAPEPEPEPSFDDGMNLEDDMALLVSNALSSANDLMQQYSEEPQTHEPSAEPMDVDHPTLPELPRVIPDFDLEPQQFLRASNIRALGTMAISILLIMSRTPFDHALSSVRDDDTEQKRAFEDARAAFDALKQIYGRVDILSATEIGLDDAESQSIFVLANLAQLGIWLTECTTTTLSTANNTFLRLIPATNSLTDDAVDLLLAIKTQLTVLSIANETSAEGYEAVLSRSLQEGLEEALRARHAGEDLSVNEQHLLTSVEVRRAGFSTDVQTPEGIAALKDKYPMTQLSKSLGVYIRTQLIASSELALKLGLTVPTDDDLPDMLGLPEDNVVAGLDMDEDLSSFFEKTTSGLVQDALAAFKGETATDANADGAATNGVNGTNEGQPGTEAPARTQPRSEYEELEALVAQSTSDYVKNTLNSMSPMSYVPQSTGDGMSAQSSYLSHLQQNLAQHQYFPFSQPQPEAPPQPSGSGDNLPPNQTCPSAMLYDKARQAALSKSSAHTRREGLHSTRRPWTQEEEKALMAGLDMVKGPHWSQILTLFGPHGTMSDILKDRTQVQLKDKARNLKLFFLKTNSEMPYYLQAVTGELKTRAPTQAARKEAEERARMTSEEDQAKLQGIMALAGGLQHHPQHQHVQQGQQLQQARPANRPLGNVGTGVMASGQTAAQTAGAQQAPGSQPAWRTTTNGQTASTANVAQRTGMQTNTSQMMQSANQGQARPQGQQPIAQMPRPNNVQQGQQQPQHTHAHPQTAPQQASNSQQAGQSQAHQSIRPAQSPAQGQPAQVARPLQQQQQPQQQTQAARPIQQQTQGQAQAPAAARPQGQSPAQPQQQTQAQVQRTGAPAVANGNAQVQTAASSASPAQAGRPIATQQPTQAGTATAQPGQQQRMMMPKPQGTPVNAQSQQQQQRLQQSGPAAQQQQQQQQVPGQNRMMMPQTQPQTGQAAAPRPAQGQATNAQAQPQQPRPAGQQQQPQVQGLQNHVQQRPQAQPQTQPQGQGQPTGQQSPQTQTTSHQQPQAQVQQQPAQAQAQPQQPHAQQQALSRTPSQAAPTPPPQAQAQAPGASPAPATPREQPPVAQQRVPTPADDDAEAALLKDLQAAVAGVTS